MFKKMIIAGCAVAMLSVSGFAPVQTADAAPRWRGRIPTPAARRIYRGARNDFRQAARRWDRIDNRWDRRYRGFDNRYRGFRGRNNGFVRTPYFSIGF